jgi:hypothetical protein
LEETAKRYLRSLVPLLSKEEYARSEAAVQEFIKPGGFGEELQARLQQVDREAKASQYATSPSAFKLTTTSVLVVRRDLAEQSLSRVARANIDQRQLVGSVPRYAVWSISSSSSAR